MTIRFARPSDIPDLLKLLLQVGQVHHRLRPDIFPAGTLKYDEAALLSLLEQEDRPIFVAASDSHVTGYAFCVLKTYPGSGVSTQRRELYIDDLCVDENHRRDGIATGLYRHVVQYAGTLGCQSITLNVWCGNREAQRFYEKMGMRQRNITMEMPLEDTQC